jgi:putative transposase
MGRPQRDDHGGYVYHVLNRANGRLPIFQKEGDYRAFEASANERSRIAVGPFAAMPRGANDWA